jgi:Uma2 family endonuclease
MGYARKAAVFLTADEYLALERRARFKHEYLEGVIYACQGQVPSGMAGGSRAHHRISLNIAAELNGLLRGTDCAPYMADMRLKVGAATGRTEDAYFYPDVFVHSGPTTPAEATEIADARVIVEVLSPSTEDFDRREKFAVYQSLPGLVELAFVDSTPPHAIEIYRREPAGHWVRVEAEDGLRLASVGLNMPRAAVLAGV